MCEIGSSHHMQVLTLKNVVSSHYETYMSRSESQQYECWKYNVIINKMINASGSVARPITLITIFIRGQPERS